ncbi:hypothetical protein EU508_11230 [Pseudoalteromonas fuliginea]|uniref:Orphan protein n=1 Tax=Pseudoalteromonas fuliginea TaxID=1872678 RepID=A0AB73BG05_9GAMM|nr:MULTISPECIES: DUF5522 domain-containing protein [Pseudoalteromonas]ALQ09276.1 hypothetical protein D172_015150 [Pseudoalteromonas sp. Bsw20308]ATG76530.1 hypothetical protein AOR04_02665 [Pseudoalteromonas sp. 1_2015MBL_MicDiv]KAA1159700.1 hypothetical protein EU508_11230 [Pseudoalteromonas fuliginea]
MTQLNCTQCHSTLTCNVDDISACWCNELPAILPLDITATSCLCRKCTLNKINTFLEGVYTQPIKTQINFAKQFRGNENLIEGLDYTMQSGYMIFSKWFFLKRGSCCKNGCKNCPYGYKK